MVIFSPLSLRKARQISGDGNGIPLQYSCLENPMDEGAWGQGSTGMEAWGWASEQCVAVKGADREA